MKIKLDTGTEYDLSNADQLRKLKTNIGNMRIRKQPQRLLHIYNQVEQYKNYTGNESALLHARDIFQLVSPLIPKQTPTSISKLQVKVAPAVHRAELKAPAFPVSMISSVSAAGVPLTTYTPSNDGKSAVVVTGKKSVEQKVMLIHHLPFKNSGYLYLDPIPAGSRYIIGNPALKSSGDIYHILPYIGISRKLGFDVPEVVFVYDSPDTKKQAMRAIGFANLFGYSDVFRTHEILTATRPRARTTNLRQYVAELTTPYYLIDQKATTLLLAKLIQNSGFKKVSNLIVQLLLEQLASAAKHDAVTMQKIQQWVECQFERIKKAAAGKEIILFNKRVAAGSNEDQDIGPEALAEIANIIQRKGCFCWYLIADSNANGQADNQTSMFSADPTITPTEDARGFYKLRHLLLLIRLRELPKLIGMAGNTSGTLDIAAFVGMWVYSFHTFSKSRGHIYVDYQDYRILLQQHFMSVGLPIVKNSGGPADPDGLLFASWIDSKGQKNIFPNVTGMTIGIQSANKPLKYKTHEDRLPFSGALTWPQRNDKRDLTSSPKLKVKTDPRFVEFKFFDAEDKALREKFRCTQEGKEIPAEEKLADAHDIFKLTAGLDIDEPAAVGEAKSAPKPQLSMGIFQPKSSTTGFAGNHDHNSKSTPSEVDVLPKPVPLLKQGLPVLSQSSFLATMNRQRDQAREELVQSTMTLSAAKL